MNKKFDELEFANRVIANKIEIEKEKDNDKFFQDLQDGFVQGFTFPFKTIASIFHKASTATIKEILPNVNINMYLLFAFLILIIFLKK